MIQGQNSQTTNSNNIIIEQIDEEELQYITGGCIGCAILNMIATADGTHSMAKGSVFGDAGEIRKGATQLAIAGDSLTTASRQVRPCANCVANTVLYGLTKTTK